MSYMCIYIYTHTHKRYLKQLQRHNASRYPNMIHKLQVMVMRDAREHYKYRSQGEMSLSIKELTSMNTAIMPHMKTKHILISCWNNVHILQVRIHCIHDCVHVTDIKLHPYIYIYIYGIMPYLKVNSLLFIQNQKLYLDNTSTRVDTNAWTSGHAWDLNNEAGTLQQWYRTDLAALCHMLSCHFKILHVVGET